MDFPKLLPANAEPPDNVVPLRRPIPPLTDAEILALRALLESSAKIQAECPLARRILSPE